MTFMDGTTVPRFRDTMHPRRSTDRSVALLALLSWTRALIAADPGADAASASSAEPASSAATAPSWIAQPQLLGAVPGREDLANHGIVFTPTFTGEVSRILTGSSDGRAHDAARMLGDLLVDVDLDQAWGWRGASAEAHGQRILGQDAGAGVGDVQGWSNINAPHRSELCEVWFQQGFGRPVAAGVADPLRVKVGKIDPDDDYLALPVTGLFYAAATSYSPVIPGLPTYPDPAASANIFVQPWGWLAAGVGMFDGSGITGTRTGKAGFAPFFDHDLGTDKFSILQVKAMWSAGSEKDAGLVEVGAWHHSAVFQRFAGGQQDGTSGYFAGAQQDLWRDDGAAVTVFAQYGWADRRVANVAEHIVAGWWWNGIGSRDGDGLGVIVARASVVAGPQAPLHAADPETSVEATYHCQVTGWWQVRPALVRIWHAGGEAGRDPVMIGALRTVVSF